MLDDGAVLRASTWQPAKRSFAPAEVEALVAQARLEARQQALSEVEALRADALSIVAQTVSQAATALRGVAEAHRRESAELALAAARGRRRGLGPAVGQGQRAGFRDRIAELGLGLENRLKDQMGLLSGGQRQAVSLLMATLAGSRILLLDEHTAALDPSTADFVLDLTRRIVAGHGLTTLMVTHSMRHALDHGDRTIMLHEGRVVLDVGGTERAGLDVPDLLAMFSRVRGQQLADDSLLIG